MKTEGTMKVVVFEVDSSNESTASAVGKLFTEAASWLMWESISEVQITPKTKDRRQFRNMSLSLSEVFEDTVDSDLVRSATMQLFIHFDDNEYQKKEK